MILKFEDFVNEAKANEEAAQQQETLLEGFENKDGDKGDCKECGKKGVEMKDHKCKKD